MNLRNKIKTTVTLATILILLTSPGTAEDTCPSVDKHIVVEDTDECQVIDNYCELPEKGYEEVESCDEWREEQEIKKEIENTKKELRTKEGVEKLEEVKRTVEEEDLEMEEVEEKINKALKTEENILETRKKQNYLKIIIAITITTLIPLIAIAIKKRKNKKERLKKEEELEEKLISLTERYKRLENSNEEILEFLKTANREKKKGNYEKTQELIEDIEKLI